MKVNEIYKYNSVVTIGDTDYTQTMFFFNFFKLQGICRELWVKDCVENGLADLRNSLVLITRDANCQFFKAFYLDNIIEVNLQFISRQRTNTKLRFRFYNLETHELHAEGIQTIVFVNSENKPIRIPENWKNAITKYADFENRN